MRLRLHLPSVAAVLVCGVGLGHAVAAADVLSACAAGVGLITALRYQALVFVMVDTQTELSKLRELLNKARKLIRDQNPEEYDALAEKAQRALRERDGQAGDPR